LEADLLATDDVVEFESANLGTYEHTYTRIIILCGIEIERIFKLLDTFRNNANMSDYKKWLDT